VCIKASVTPRTHLLLAMNTTLPLVIVVQYAHPSQEAQQVQVPGLVQEHTAACNDPTKTIEP
jgi:hypothetical protein